MVSNDFYKKDMYLNIFYPECVENALVQKEVQNGLQFSHFKTGLYQYI